MLATALTPMIFIIELLCLILIGTAGADHSSTDASSSHGVAWFVQLSDLHINRWVHHEILPDLHAFGQQVLRSTRPGALLITGDLVDAKTRPEGSQQHEEEWQAYEQAWRHLARCAQLPASAILDLRGNHDVFDTLRNSGQDLFTFHSATAAAHGQAAAASQRVWAWGLKHQLLLPGQHHSSRSHRSWQHQAGSRDGRRQLLTGSDAHSSNRSSSSRDGVQHMRRFLGSTGAQQAKKNNRHLQSLHSNGEPVAGAARNLAAAAAGSLAAAGPPSCPAAVLLGLDFTPNVGLHSPANFFGVATGGLLAQIQQQLAQLRSSSSSSSADEARSPLLGGCSSSVHVPIISYSHYPFSTVAAGYGSSSSRGGVPVEGGRAVRDLLASYDVSAHLSGHLHDLLGPRMHAMHPKRAGRVTHWQRQQQQQGLHTVGSGPAAAEGLGVQGSAADGLEGGADGGVAYLADLEAADFKEARRWRLVVLDSGATSFADLTFKRTPCSSSAGDGSCVAAGAAAAADGLPDGSSIGDGSSGGDDGSSSGIGSGSGGYSYAVAAIDGSRAVGQHVVVISWPPDGRYSPLMMHVDDSSSSARQQQHKRPDIVAAGGAGTEQQGKAGDVLLPVRALVVPLKLRGAASSSKLADVQLDWSCQGQGLMAGLSSSSSRTMHPVGRPAAAGDSGDHGSTAEDAGYPYALVQPQVFGTHLPLNSGELVRCGSSGVLLLQVTVRDDAGGVSTSDLRPVALQQLISNQRKQSSSSSSTGRQQGAADSAAVSDPAPAEVTGSSGSSQQQQQDRLEPEGHLPLPLAVFEDFIVTFDGAAFAVGLFFTGWLLQVVGLLLLPRLFGHYFITANAFVKKLGSNSSSAGSSLLSHSQQQLDYPASCKKVSLRCRPAAHNPVQLLRTLAGLTARALCGLVLQLLRLLLLPFVSMAVLAQQHPGLWCCMLAHCAWVLAGPWFVAQLSSGSQGLGLWFRYGLWLPLPAELSGAWVRGEPVWPAAAAASAASAASAAAAAAGDGGGIGGSSGGGSGSDWQEWVWLPLPDTYLISSLTVWMVLAPVTLWLGLVVSYWHGAAAAARRSSGGGNVAAATAAATTAAAVAAAAAAAAPFVMPNAWGRQVSSHIGPAEDGWEAVALDDGGGISGDQENGDGSNSCSSSNRSSEQQQGQAVGGSSSGEGNGGGDVSSSSSHRLARSRSKPVTRRRDSVELSTSIAAAGVAGADGSGGDGGGGVASPVKAAAAAALYGSSSVSGVSRTNSSCIARTATLDAEAQAEGLLLGPAAAAGPPTAATAATAAAGGAWLIKLLPPALAANFSSGSSIEDSSSDSCWWLLPVVAASAVVSPAKKTLLQAAGAEKDRSCARLSPVYVAWCVVYIILLCLRAAGRALQLLLVSIRLPVHLVLLLLPIGLAWYKACWRIAAAYGPVALLASPVFGWLPLLVLLALRHVRHHLAAGKARRQE